MGRGQRSSAGVGEMSSPRRTSQRFIAVSDEEFARAVAAFEEATPNIGIWKRWPEVSQEEDEFTDTWACESVASEFAEFLQARGVQARLVRGEDSEHPMHDSHCWVRVSCAAGEMDVDWTARQFYDLEWPPDENHQDLPCPLIWPAGDGHPVSGRYDRLTVD